MLCTQICFQPRLRAYELQLENHVRSVQTQLEDQFRKQVSASECQRGESRRRFKDFALRELRARDARLREAEPKAKRELRALKSEVEKNAKFERDIELRAANDEAAQRTALQNLDESRDELIGELQRGEILIFKLQDARLAACRQRAAQGG